MEIADRRIGFYVPERQVSIDGLVRKWGMRQFALFALLAEHADETMSISFIHANIWANPHFDPRTVPIGVYMVRGHLGPELGNRHTGAILNVRGKGYMARSTLGGRLYPQTAEFF